MTGFYVRLAAWYNDTGDVRDHKEMFVVTLCLSDFPGHRDVGLAMLRQLPPYQVLRVLDFVHGRKTTKTVVEKAKRAKGGKGKYHKAEPGRAAPVGPKVRAIVRGPRAARGCAPSGPTRPGPGEARASSRLPTAASLHYNPAA